MRSHGFTLIEVLIVISIIAILLAIAIPSYQGVIRRGQATAAQSHNQVVRLAVQQWLGFNPARSAAALSGTNCAQPTTLGTSGATSGYVQGALGWSAPRGTVTCSVQGSGRTFTVTTAGGGKTYVNGAEQ